jgi:hypothetical protein
MYDLEQICKMSLEIKTYEIYKQYGNGVIEAPYKEGEVIGTLECSEFDAFIISESMNINTWGIISKRNSWESFMFRYKIK